MSKCIVSKESITKVVRDILIVPFGHKEFESIGIVSVDKISSIYMKSTVLQCTPIADINSIEDLTGINASIMSSMINRGTGEAFSVVKLILESMTCVNSKLLHVLERGTKASELSKIFIDDKFMSLDMAIQTLDEYRVTHTYPEFVNKYIDTIVTSHSITD